jgi:hypothetical protein
VFGLEVLQQGSVCTVLAEFALHLQWYPCALTGPALLLELCHAMALPVLLSVL